MFNMFRAQPAIREMTPREAHEAAKKGEIVLVDVRTPGEWMKTGLAENAIPLSLQDPNFLSRLEEAAGGDKSKPVAFICASGARSGQVAVALKGYGWEDPINVTGGMTGSFREQGWLQLGLPTKPFNG